MVNWLTISAESERGTIVAVHMSLGRVLLANGHVAMWDDEVLPSAGDECSVDFGGLARKLSVEDRLIDQIILYTSPAAQPIVSALKFYGARLETYAAETFPARRMRAREERSTWRIGEYRVTIERA